MTNCCAKNKVWVNKFADLEVQDVDSKGALTKDYVAFDVNVFICKVCNKIHLSAD